MSLKIGINGFGRIGRMVLRSIIENDRKDRLNLQQSIETCVHPLIELESPMCNIYSGEIAASNAGHKISKSVSPDFFSKTGGTDKKRAGIGTENRD